MAASSATPPSPRTLLKRAAARGDYSQDTVREILDAGFLCHVAVTMNDHPTLIPMVYARLDDQLLLHGSTANRVLRTLRDGAEACVAVTHLDGLILARSAFHHSVNYRSVVIYGHAHEVTDGEAKQAAFQAFVDQAIPDRWSEVRAPNREEFLRTMVLRIPIDEASAKVRVGGVVDEAEDYAHECWAGVIPLALTSGTPVPDERLAPNVTMPPHVANYGKRA